EDGGGFGWRLGRRGGRGEDSSGGDEMKAGGGVEMTVVMRWQRRWCCGDDGEGGRGGDVAVAVRWWRRDGDDEVIVEMM
ncbi:hypothetical protein Tco_1521681, partial [Tanacetum coccineum]